MYKIHTRNFHLQNSSTIDYIERKCPKAQILIFTFYSSYFPGVLRKEEPIDIEPHEASSSNAMSESRSNIEPVAQRRISRTIDSKSNTVPVDNQIPGKRSVPPPENGHSSNGNDGEMTTEKDDKKITSQLTVSTGNEKLFTRRRPPYTKSCSAPSLPVQKLEEAVESEEI